LTRREREIVRAILEGCSNHEIAARAGVSIQTIKNQLTTIYEKFGVRNRLQLALAVVEPWQPREEDGPP
jgi:DNA-binding NarL/FixJ family response regulator